MRWLGRYWSDMRQSAHNQVHSGKSRDRCRGRCRSRAESVGCRHGRQTQIWPDRLMLSEPGFWPIIAGAVLVAVGFIGLAFSRLGNEMPVHDEEPNGEQLAGLTTSHWTAIKQRS